MNTEHYSAELCASDSVLCGGMARELDLVIAWMKTRYLFSAFDPANESFIVTCGGTVEHDAFVSNCCCSWSPLHLLSLRDEQLTNYACLLASVAEKIRILDDRLEFIDNLWYCSSQCSIK